MGKKVNAEKAQVENVNVVANEANHELATKAENAKLEAQRLMEQAKKAAEEARQAAKEAREAAKKAKAFTSRPKRMSTFELRICQTSAEVMLGGEYMMTKDVHYCVEKEAIDCLVDIRENGSEEDFKKVYLVNKVSKEVDETTGERKSRILVEKLYLDPETKMIIID